MNYVAIDIETADTANSAPCAIGLAFIENNMLTHSEEILVNPEVKFSPIASKIHGITAEDIKNAPTMAEVWPKIKKLYQPGMLVAAHNARFDCRVMEKSLARYNIPAPHYFAIDTLATSKAFEPYLPNHKLDTVSEALNINLWHHHNALSDSEACAGILIEENKRVGDDPIKKMVKPI